MPPSLSNDILLLIGEFLEDHQDRYNLLFVCRHFHGLFRRLVYRYAALKDCSQTRSFLSAALRHPELARAVRALDLSGWRTHSEAYEGTSVTVDEMEVFRNWAQEISRSDEEYIQWEQDLQQDVAEAWMALLLPLVRNVQQLRLVYPKENKYLDRMMQRAVQREKPFDTQPAFRALRQVSLGHLDDTLDSKGTYAPSQVLPFFQLPSMRAVAVDSVVESTSADEQPQPEQEQEQEQEQEPSPTSSVSEIVLNSSSGANGMTSIVAACSAIRSFKYQHSDDHLLAEGYQPAAFYRSLSASKHTLHTLWLDSCGVHLPFTMTGANETHEEWFGSLADFKSLKDVRIRLPNLLDIRYQAEPSVPLTELLPAGVESLYMEGCKENSLAMLVNQLRTLLSARHNGGVDGESGQPPRFKDLKKLEIEGMFHDEEDYDDSGYEGFAAGAKVIKPRVYEMVRPLRRDCEFSGVGLFIRDRVCPETMK
ncbi:hypothetical protein KXX25_004660 [Aspergillus fumigatus]|nr:hypothetical protein KXX34_005146 [Aspergillus fumigatus]KAH1713702.1 hypothetical protein KXX40_004793 [Aspergillus fumigatus]KAH1716544.1 hypothetical protein KXX25_004660 [Aspergillus fumigatus]KAH2082286.1 hypothetical protein KXW86_001764 [Aspergillus fumigatus]KAH2264382.1 hypothetical protein KXW96_001671 [Aspergillus fumigatus]